MAAKNPFRVSDLVAKYGWKIMVYLSNLGITVLTEAQILFVDSNHTNALDADDTEHGHSFEKPLATIDYAIGLCTAEEQSIIIAAPGHNDSLADTQIDFDVSGVHIIGVGEGSLKPRIDFDHANSSIDIGANNVSIQNIDLLPSIPAILIGVHVETDVTDFKMKDVRFLIGEDGAGADEFVKAVELTSGNDDCVFENVLILAHASAGSATHGIHVAAAADRGVYRNVIIDGPYATGGIVETAAGVNLIVEDCAVDVSGTNYDFDGSSTFAKRVNNVDGQVREDDSESLLVEDRGSAAYPSGITDESIWAYLLSKSATPVASSYDNATDSLEAISDAVGAISSPTDVTGAVPDTPTAKSLQDILSKADGSNTFDNTTDSLEAISEAVAAITSGVSSAVPEPPTGKSLQDILHKDGSYTFDNTTDSLEMTADRIGGFSGDGGAAVDDSIKASLDLAHTDLDAILADTISISGSTLPVAPVANSLAAFIASGGTALGQELPDSMSLVDIIGNFTGAYDGNAYDDNIFACLKVMSTFFADGDGDFANGSAMPSNVSIYDCFGGFSGDGGAAQDDSIKASLDLAHTELDKIGTIVNTAGTATIGAILGDFANSSLVTRLGNLQTDADQWGTLANTAGTAELGAMLGDFANVTLVTQIANLQTEVDKIGTISNAGGTAELGAALGPFANSTLVARLDVITADTAAIDPGAKRLITATLTDWALSATNALFTVSGMVKARIWGEVLVPVASVATNLKISSTPTAPGGLVDIASNLDCNADAAGTIYKMNATFGGAMVEVTGGVSADDGVEVILPAGVVQMGSSANEAGGGSIQWFCQYEPLEAGATVTAT